MTVHRPFHLLEINLISAQDLSPVSRSMRTYAVAWVHPDRKLTTRVDQHGHANPTWNDKFVFRVDEEFLNSDTCAVMIEIYAMAWLRDVRVGIVRVLINNLLPPTSARAQMRFLALQVRRPSGRPQGILNMGVALLDSTMRSMPLYTQLNTSALGYKDLMGEKQQNNNHNNYQEYEEEEEKTPKIQLKRSQSERTELIHEDFPPKTGSMCNGSDMWPPVKANGSVCSDVGPSPSVVAAAVAKGLYPADDAASSILEDWTADSVEGLRSKIERWRTELPPIYDRDYHKYTPKTRHSRRHTDGGGGGGLFSCFGNAYGCEFSITCGAKSTRKKGYGNNKVHLSPSDDQTGSYLIP